MLVNCPHQLRDMSYRVSGAGQYWIHHCQWMISVLRTHLLVLIAILDVQLAYYRTNYQRLNRDTSET